MGFKYLIGTWITRITAVLFCLVIILLMATTLTATNAISFVVIWVLSFLYWVIYSGHELMVMLRVIFLFILKKIKRQSLIDSYDSDALLEALIYFRSRMISMWDGHIIPFLIYMVFTSMVFGILTSNIYVVIGVATIMQVLHVLLRKLCITIIQYAN